MSHHVFWMGDMNYRVTFNKEHPEDEGAFVEKKASKGSNIEVKAGKKNASNDMDRIVSEAQAKEEEEEAALDTSVISSKRQGELDRVSKMIEQEEWEDILALDELNREIKAGRALNGFRALQPSFPPTFKRIRNREIKKEASQAQTLSLFSKPKKWQSGLDSSEKETRFYDYKRMPSFTDRILVKSLPGFVHHVKDRGMESCENVMSSDHKPVRAFFDVSTTIGMSGIIENTDIDSRITLEISNLSAKGLASMDLNGTSDPYVYVLSDPADVIDEHSSKKLKSDIIYKELNPVWKDEVLSVTMNGRDMEGLKNNAHLFLTVWDEDTFVRDMSLDHDLIGLISVSFADIVDSMNTGKPIVRTETLMSNGYANGTLSFTIKAFSPELGDHTSSKKKKKGPSLFNLKKQFSMLWKGGTNNDRSTTMNAGVDGIVDAEDVEVTDVNVDSNSNTMSPKPGECCLVS